MGLCKCPKKKVTTLFCFEHRVNVCEHCLVSNHPRCIVQSYLQWLQDSDYNPNCQLCNHLLNDEDAGECARLVCYDVFHWSCLDKYARQLPSNTAPAGYTCPRCKTGIFPAANNCSPVAEALKSLLSKVNWARAGLGLPLIEEPAAVAVVDTADSISIESHKPSEVQHTPAHHGVAASNTSYYSPLTPHQAYAAHPAATVPASTAPASTPVSSYNTQSYKSTHSVVNVDDSAPYNRASDKSADFFSASVPRKLFDARDDRLNLSADHDEDKYKRRPALQWLFRWFKSTSMKGRRDPNANKKRLFIIVMLGILAFVTLMLIMFRLGRSSADNDPFLDPMANPNIRINARN